MFIEKSQITFIYFPILYDSVLPTADRIFYYDIDSSKIYQPFFVSDRLIGETLILSINVLGTTTSLASKFSLKKNFLFDLYAWTYY